ncbi:fimbrial protein [Pantoea sp. JK]|uniref:fimbrial protein n=1 Tax=Pantoea sp. JK TaxID=2871703 RepID=UPI0022378401|nr:fimbrial protein [Pantoea sp. JK]MCW6030434.1 fimbrial protein [Pantoea sp. JK]
MFKALIFTVLMLPLSALADESLSAHITVTGHFYVETSCSLSQPSTIAFGDVITTEVNEGTREENLGLTLTCQNFNPLQDVILQIDAVDGYANIIPVSGAKGIQLALKRNGADQNLATPIKMTSSGPLNLSVTIVKKAGEPYEPGDFTASATIKVDVI